jgi:glycosyltransferase involved in cell wall biosynthesis
MRVHERVKQPNHAQRSRSSFGHRATRRSRRGAAPSSWRELNVLYAGRLTREKGLGLLADAFLAARAREPRLHLVLPGSGPEEPIPRERLGVAATFLGWLDQEQVADTYAAADIFLFASRTDTFGQVLLEAQASGLPVVAVAEGGPTALLDDGRTRRLCAAEPEVLADAPCQLATPRSYGVASPTGRSPKSASGVGSAPLNAGGRLPPDAERSHGTARPVTAVA